MAYEVILFDVDGTLCNPGRSMLESAKYALNQLGINETDETNLNRLIGPPLEHAFRDCYGFDEETTNNAVRLFREKMQKDGTTLYDAYPGIRELLSELKNAGKTLAVVTSKIDHIATDVLNGTSLLQYFEVMSAQQPDIVVDKEIILSKALDDLGVEANSEVVMIGDRKHDIEAANAHGVDSIGVLWGYGSSDELKNEAATFLAKDVKELRKILLG